MFDHFDPQALSHSDCKEDSVREVVIVPILARLGYHVSGNQTVTRSKTLVHPFIHVGTRQHPVTIIPDYTLNFQGKPIAVLDAKGPNEDLTDVAHVQQAYSYAIHPEVRAGHFALCNGRRLIVYSVLCATPLLDLPFDDFESKWDQIVKHLSPMYLLQPHLRDFRPDFGFKLSRILAPHAKVTMIGMRLNTFARVSEDLFTATVNTDFAGEPHCVSVDFHPTLLPKLVAGLPQELSAQFLEALARAPFQACADLVVEVDIDTHLGDEVRLEAETFVPLVIDTVMGSRFNPYYPEPPPQDVPLHIFRLSKAFSLAEGASGEA